jgi:uncharacterized membrane protein
MFWDYSTGIGIVTQLLFWGVMVILAARPWSMAALPHEIRYIDARLAILRQRSARGALTRAEYEHVRRIQEGAVQR